MASRCRDCADATVLGICDNDNSFCDPKLEEGWAMQDKPVVTRFPLCRALGIVSYPKGEPRVLFRDLKNALSPAELERWAVWAQTITQDNLGIFAWDVEDFLAGRPNTD